MAVLPGVLGSTLMLAAAAANAPGYRLLEKIQVGGQGGWDYLTVDSRHHRLFVSHGNKVEVIATGTLKKAGEILDTPGAHGIALAPEVGKGYISAGNANRVVVFDWETLKVVGSIPAGEKPDAIIYDPGSARILVANGESNNLTVIDPKAGKAVATIALGGVPEFLVADARGSAWVNLEDKNEMIMLDLKTNRVAKHIPLTGCDKPSSMDMDRTTRRLFAGCRNKVLAVVDADRASVVANVPIGDHVDATVFDPARKLVFNSNGDGTITVIREETPDRFSVLETAVTQRGAKTMALDPESNAIYLSTAEGLSSTATGGPSSKGPAVKTGPFVVLVLTPAVRMQNRSGDR
ncbi:MAG: YncE family protein [Bryobacterales bacterium]|nr:YncE family protein [Bryobacterales bacterium]